MSAFTAAHPLISQFVLWYLLVLVALLIFWACKPRDDETPIAAPGPRRVRRKVQ